MPDLNWTDAQWQLVNDAVNDAFTKSSVASLCLPRYGPLSGSAEIVRNELITLTPPASQASPVPTLTLNSYHADVNRPLVNLTVRIELSSEQVADEALSNALLLFRRAGSILAQEEDGIVFVGWYEGKFPSDSKYVANRDVGLQFGLANLRVRRGFPSLAVAAGATPDRIGLAVVDAVVQAIGDLESESNPGPFACVLGNHLYDAVHTPTPSLVLPADRISPFLKGGPLLRAGRIDGQGGSSNQSGIGNAGIVISQAGSTVDVVVGTEPTVQFLQRTQDAKFLFRVYERFALRVRDNDTRPVRGFRLPLAEVEANRELMLLQRIGI
jgi:Encapsulating protein for peroxidase